MLRVTHEKALARREVTIAARLAAAAVFALGCGAPAASSGAARTESAPVEQTPAGAEACRRWIIIPALVAFPIGEATPTRQSEDVLGELARGLRAHSEIDAVYLIGLAHHRSDRDPTPALGMARARAMAEWLFEGPGGVPAPALVVIAGGISTDEPCAGSKAAKKCSASYRYAMLALRVPRACEPGEAPSFEWPDPRLRPNIEQVEEAVFTPEGPAAPSE